MHRRVARRLGVPVVAGLLLAGCSDAQQGETPGPNLATVTGGGRSLSFPDDLARSDYPNPCPLLPTASAQALVGSPVTASRTSVGCTWTAGVASVPSISLAFVQIGSQAADRYVDRVRGSLAAASVRAGDRARVYGLDENRTTRVDVLDGNAFFRVEVRSPLNAAQDVADARAIAVRTAQLVAKQVN